MYDLKSSERGWSQQNKIQLQSHRPNTTVCEILVQKNVRVLLSSAIISQRPSAAFQGGDASVCGRYDQYLEGGFYVLRS